MGIRTVVNAQLFDARGRSVQSIMVRVPVKNPKQSRKSSSTTNPGGVAVPDRVVSDETVPITFGGNHRQQQQQQKTSKNNATAKRDRQQQQVLVFNRSRR